LVARFSLTALQGSRHGRVQPSKYRRRQQSESAGCPRKKTSSEGWRALSTRVSAHRDLRFAKADGKRGPNTRTTRDSHHRYPVPNPSESAQAESRARSEDIGRLTMLVIPNLDRLKMGSVGLHVVVEERRNLEWYEIYTTDTGRPGYFRGSWSACRLQPACLGASRL